MNAYSASQEKNATFILVHGAWHGGWCWRRVADRLAADGHRVFAPTLTGLGDRSHLLTPHVNLTTHINDVVNLVLWEELDEIVLCGHSYAGMVITGAAEALQSRVRALVYLDAIVPRAGQSVLDCHVEAGALSTVQLFEALAADSNGHYLAPFSAEMLMVGAADRAWVDARCTTHPYATFKEALPATYAAERISQKVYVRANGFDMPMLRAQTERLKGDPTWKLIELPYGHDLMVDAPAQVADILRAASND